MQFDMAAKRANRLLARNFASAQVEAHKLGSLGLPFTKLVIEDGSYVELEAPSDDGADFYYRTVHICADGGWWATTCGSGRGCISQAVEGETLIEAVTKVLEMALALAQKRAGALGQVAQRLKEVANG